MRNGASSHINPDRIAANGGIQFRLTAMVALQSSNPVMTSLFLLSLAVSGLLLVARRVGRVGGPAAPIRLASGLGAVALGVAIRRRPRCVARGAGGTIKALIA